MPSCGGVFNPFVSNFQKLSKSDWYFSNKVLVRSSFKSLCKSFSNTISLKVCQRSHRDILSSDNFAHPCQKFDTRIAAAEHKLLIGTTTKEVFSFDVTYIRHQDLYISGRWKSVLSFCPKTSEPLGDRQKIWMKWGTVGNQTDQILHTYQEIDFLRFFCKILNHLFLLLLR